MKYKEHLDWHFRENRRIKNSERKPYSRLWYNDISQWGGKVKEIKEEETTGTLPYYTILDNFTYKYIFIYIFFIIKLINYLQKRTGLTFKKRK